MGSPGGSAARELIGWVVAPHTNWLLIVDSSPLAPVSWPRLCLLVSAQQPAPSTATSLASVRTPPSRAYLSTDSRAGLEWYT